TVTDTIPSSFLSATSSDTGFAGVSGGVATWNNQTIAAGGDLILHLSGTISSSATGTITDTANVPVTVAQGDTTQADNTDTETDTLNPQWDLSIVKMDNHDSGFESTTGTDT